MFKTNVTPPKTTSLPPIISTEMRVSNLAFGFWKCFHASVDVSYFEPAKI